MSFLLHLYVVLLSYVCHLHNAGFLTALGYQPLPGEPISKEDVLMLPPHHPLLSEPSLLNRPKVGGKQT
jgi:hypothetical protein